jgi:hypothetical protein
MLRPAKRTRLVVSQNIGSCLSGPFVGGHRHHDDPRIQTCCVPTPWRASRGACAWRPLRQSMVVGHWGNAAEGQRDQAPLRCNSLGMHCSGFIMAPTSPCALWGNLWVRPASNCQGAEMTRVFEFIGGERGNRTIALTCNTSPLRKFLSRTDG